MPDRYGKAPDQKTTQTEKAHLQDRTVFLGSLRARMRASSDPMRYLVMAISSNSPRVPRRPPRSKPTRGEGLMATKSSGLGRVSWPLGPAGFHSKAAPGGQRPTANRASRPHVPDIPGGGPGAIARQCSLDYLAGATHSEAKPGPGGFENVWSSTARPGPRRRGNTRGRSAARGFQRRL
jgi:hypothetical protein